MLKKTVLLVMTMMVASCASGFDSTSQRIHFDLVNMQKARCDVYNYNGVTKSRAYILELPGAYAVERSLEDLHLECQGLRGLKAEMIVPSQMNPTTASNAANAGVGVLVDIASQAAFKYPDRITVDFTPAIIAEGRAKSGPVPANIVPFHGDEVMASEPVMDTVYDPLCDRNDSKMKCAHKTFNPDVPIQ